MGPLVATPRKLYSSKIYQGLVSKEGNAPTLRLSDNLGIVADATCDETKYILIENVVPQRNVEFEVVVYSCFARRRRRRKRLDTFHARFKQLSKNCSFYDVDREIKSQIIQQWPLNKVQEKGLSEPNITVAEATSRLMHHHMASELCSRTRWQMEQTDLWYSHLGL